MGYSRTPRAIERTKPLLEEMLNSSKSIEWIFDNPDKAAYKIWEAIRYSVKSDKKEYSKYSSLLNKFKIQVIPPDIVRAEIRDVPVLSPNGVIIREVTEILEVIGAVIENKRDRLVFPDVDEEHVDSEDLEILTNWCDNNKYEWEFGNGRLELRKI